MKYENLVKLICDLPCFDLPLLVQATGEPRDSLKTQLSRWMAKGWIIALRRGFYRLADPFARIPLVSAELSGLIYTPSYLSDVWALSYYDLIPERVVELTAVTTRVPRQFRNPVGSFTYRHIKQTAFFGYEQKSFGGRPVLVADPEKALLDHWHLSPGEWTDDRLSEMRYQHMELVRAETLIGYAERFTSSRLRRAANQWLKMRENEGEGEETL